MNDPIGVYIYIPYKHIDECFMAKCGKKSMTLDTAVSGLH